jgi:putative ABC transport system ATP-binding protein
VTAHQLKAAMPVAAPDIVTMSGVRFAWPSRDSFRMSIGDFKLANGERLLLTGPSGSGKSTFLSLLTGIVTPQAGSIDILGTDIATLRGAARDRFRGEHFGIIFQMFNLLPYGSVLDNVLLPLSFSADRRNRATAGHSAEAEAARLLAKLGMEPSLVQAASAASLSVGQQQRVAAARALIGAPRIIIADEPTSALDRDRQEAFLDLLFAVVAEAGATLIMVSHDESLGPRFSRVAALESIARIEHGGGAA